MNNAKAAKSKDEPLDEIQMENDERNSATENDVMDESDESKESISESQKQKVNLFEPKVIEGKRERKVIQRLDLMSKPKEKQKIESSGKGDKLGDIARINHSIGKLKAPLLKPLHKIVYDRLGAASSLRKNLRLFNGFAFEEDSDLYNKKMEKMKKLHKPVLKTMCETLDLERSGNNLELSERIMKFLLQPTNSNRPVLKKKKRTSKNSKGEKSRKKKPQKKVENGKSKPIIMDSCSDEEEEEEEEVYKENRKNSTALSQTHDDSEDKSDAEDLDSDAKKDMAEKMKRPPVKRKAPAKTKAKTKKADSSSNKGKKTSRKKMEDSECSEDDEPLIKLIKKPPNDEQLTEFIQGLLETANLEEVTIKQITRQVYDQYPDFDLTDRKQFIRETVKRLIS